ncbi:dGTP triphosphohydrolase [Ferruginibacter sp.]
MNWNDLLSNKRLRVSKRLTATDPRNDFESDFGRVIFSPATRRMHDKTQVFPLTSDDNTHSRLTHSMEVMAVGHSLGLKVCENKEFQERTGRTEADLYRQIPVLLKNACLVHDIGNPPFGHFGETVIQNYFEEFCKEQEISRAEKKKLEEAGDLEGAKKIKIINLSDDEPEDFTKFDGNAQGFRVLTKLQILDDDKGLNLTSATLCSYLKYPNTGPIIKAIINKKKRGVFQSEKKYLEEVATNCGLILDGEIKRHPLSFLMEAADSICYLVMDIEDGFSKGWYNYNFVKENFSKIPGLNEQFEKLDKENTTNGIEITKMANLRIYLIGKLVNLASSNFLNNLDIIYKGEYHKELIFDDGNELAKCLQTFCIREIFPKRPITSLELTGHSVLTGLLDYYIKFMFHKDRDYRDRAVGLISSGIKRVALIENGHKETESIEVLNDYYKLRIIVDFVSGMTDQFALNHYQKLSGQKII